MIKPIRESRAKENFCDTDTRKLEIFDPVVSKTDNGIDIEDEIISLDMYGNLHAGCDFSWDDKSHVITNILSDPAWIQTIYNKFTESSL